MKIFVIVIIFLLSINLAAADKRYEAKVREMLVEKGFSPTTISISMNTSFLALSRGALSRILRNINIKEDSLIYSYTLKFRDGSLKKAFQCTFYTTYYVDKKRESDPYDISKCKEIKHEIFLEMDAPNSGTPGAR